MHILIKHLNALSKADQVDFASRCGTTVGYLRKAASIGQLLGEKLCVSIERESAGAVTRVDLRDDWREIWPELAKRVAQQEAADA